MSKSDVPTWDELERHHREVAAAIADGRVPAILPPPTTVAAEMLADAFVELAAACRAPSPRWDEALVAVLEAEAVIRRLMEEGR